MMQFPHDWYWSVAGVQDHLVWSSLEARYCTVSDERYRAWKEGGGAPTRIASEAELADVLYEYKMKGPTPPTRYSIPKNLIFARATDAEAEAMDAAISGAGARLRRIYEGATHIDTADPLFDLLRSALVQVVGAERATELLAPAL